MSRSRHIARLPYYLLGAMSLVSFGGPLVIFLVLRGGRSPDWPPDRAIEWVVVSFVIVLAVALFVACLSFGSWYSRLQRAGKQDASEANATVQQIIR